MLFGAADGGAAQNKGSPSVDDSFAPADAAWRHPFQDNRSTAPEICVGSAATWRSATFNLQRNRKFTMEQAQLIQAAASIAGGMAAAHYDRFSGLVASRITEIAETAVKIAKAIEIEARKLP